MDGVRGIAKQSNELLVESQFKKNWQEHLDEWLESLKPHADSEKGAAKNTVRTYTNMLQPWVTYLLSNGGVPHSMLIKQYLDSKFSTNPKNYNRIGRQIVFFTNLHINGDVVLKKKSTLNQPNKMHSQMSETDVNRMKSHVRARLVAFDKGKDTSTPKNELVKYLAIYFQLISGCRPNEAACVMFDKTVKKYHGWSHFTWDKIDYIATVSEDLTKTKTDYRWLLKTVDNVFYNVLMKVSVNDYQDRLRLYAGLDYWFEKVRGDAGVSETDSRGGFLSMRSVRCYHATEWVKTRAEMLFMKWSKGIPPNPLQHTTQNLTIKTYAEKGADDMEAAQ